MTGTIGPDGPETVGSSAMSGMRPGCQRHHDLLAEMNRDLAPGVDWTAGALDYVRAEMRKYGHDNYAHYLLSKPFSPVPPGEGGRGARAENLHYLTNLCNAFGLLDLPGGAAVLDVACGSGWFSQFFWRMGYATYGFDVCPDMVELSRRRMREDARLDKVASLIDERFFLLDIERELLPTRLHGKFQAIVLESCLHHFVDPVTALSNLADGLADDGIMLIIEGENRVAGLAPQYLAVMDEFSTLERPYQRRQFTRALELAGLPHHEFLGRLNGWFRPDDARLHDASQRVRDDAASMNLAVSARSRAALDRVLP